MALNIFSYKLICGEFILGNCSKYRQNLTTNSGMFSCFIEKH